jgi:hypothetical protein
MHLAQFTLDLKEYIQQYPKTEPIFISVQLYYHFHSCYENPAFKNSYIHTE